MNELQIFNHQEFGEVRSVSINGTTHFVGNDVAGSLEYARPYEAVTAHCDGAVTYRVIDSIGREQETKVIPIGDVLRLITQAAKQSRNLAIREKAHRYESWIFDEVLPTIHQTGSYSMPSVKPMRHRKKSVSQVFLQEMRMASGLATYAGIQPGIAMAVAIDRTERKTGEDLGEYKALLPSAKRETGFLNATQIGEPLGKNARAVNALLCDLGLQAKVDGEWRLTDAGKEYGEEMPYVRNGHSGYQIRWNEALVDVLRAG